MLNIRQSKFSFNFMYDYHSKIYYEIEDNFVVKKISVAKNRIRQLNEMRNQCVQRLKYVDPQQTKYYNRKHIFISFAIEDLIMLFIKNFKQKRFNKK